MPEEKEEEIAIKNTTTARVTRSGARSEKTKKKSIEFLTLDSNDEDFWIDGKEGEERTKYVRARTTQSGVSALYLQDRIFTDETQTLKRARRHQPTRAAVTRVSPSANEAAMKDGLCMEEEEEESEDNVTMPTEIFTAPAISMATTISSVTDNHRDRPIRSNRYQLPIYEDTINTCETNLSMLTECPT